MKCPKHPEQTLYPLKYQKASGKLTKGGNRGTDWIASSWHLCEACKVPVLVKVTVTIDSVPTHKDTPTPSLPVQTV